MNHGKALFYKGDNLTKLLRDVISVKANKKYGYYEITQKIYHHTLITTARFNEVDKIVFVDKDGNRNEIGHDD